MERLLIPIINSSPGYSLFAKAEVRLSKCDIPCSYLQAKSLNALAMANYFSLYIWNQALSKPLKINFNQFQVLQIFCISFVLFYHVSKMYWTYLNDCSKIFIALSIYDMQKSQSCSKISESHFQSTSNPLFLNYCCRLFSMCILLFWSKVLSSVINFYGFKYSNRYKHQSS